MSWHGHQGFIYYMPPDEESIAIFERVREEERQEQRKCRIAERFMLDTQPYLEEKWRRLWWKIHPWLAEPMFLFLFSVERISSRCIVVTMRKPKTELPFRHEKKRPSRGKGRKFYRSSCDKECPYCHGSLPGCGRVEEALAREAAAEAAKKKAVAEAKADAEAKAAAEAQAED